MGDDFHLKFKLRGVYCLLDAGERNPVARFNFHVGTKPEIIDPLLADRLCTNLRAT
jgi:hypothetical protein